MSELKNKLVRISTEMLNKMLTSPEMSESFKQIPMIARPFLQPLIQKLPGYLAEWISQQDEEVIRKKIVWIKEDVLPWILSESTPMIDVSSEE